jgi:PAS domain S-box-containing protein
VSGARRRWLYFGSAAIAGGAIDVALTLTSNHEQHRFFAIGLGLLVSWSFVFAGLTGWSRRPESDTGLLMVVVGFAALVSGLSEANASIPFTLGEAFGSIFIAAFVQLLLAYPSGHLLTWYARALIVAGYVTAVVGPVAQLTVQPPSKATCGAAGHGTSCPDNAFLISPNHGAYVGIQIATSVAAALLLLGALTLMIIRFRKASPALRRVLRAVYVAGGLCIALFVVGFATSPTGSVSSSFNVALIVSFCAVPFVFLAGLHRATLARASAATVIFREIPERATPEEVQEGLRRALSDPTLEVAYWYPDRGHYVDAAGNRIELPAPTKDRVVTRLDYADVPVAALIHDAALLEDPELLDAVAGTARISLERDRLLVEGRARAERYRALLNALPDLTFSISRDGTYLGYNAPRHADLYEHEVVGRTVWDRLPRDVADRIMAAGRHALDDEKTHTLEYSLDFDGETRHYEGRIAASGEDEFLFVVRNITERVDQQRELVASRARIVAAGDEARRHLERNLHDGAQQRLVALSVSLRLAQSQLRTNPGAANEILSAASEELAQALAELRELARGIHPAVLTDRGLDAALDALAARAPLPVEVQSCGQRLPPAVEAAAYYLVSEALANVTKHANASSVRVRVTSSNGAAHVEVIDDGIGGADPTRGSGLRGLADRVASLDGTLQVESSGRSGTTVRASIPLGVG